MTGNDSFLTTCNWLNLLPLQLSETTDFLEPQQDMERGDHEIGLMTEDHKRLFTLWRAVKRSAEEAVIQAKYAQSREQALEEKKRAEELALKAHILGDIFWVSLNDHYDVWDKESIGVRRGFKVVWSEEPMQSHGLIDFLTSGGDPFGGFPPGPR